MLDKLPIDHKAYLLTLYNEIFEKGAFPESWKSSLVVLILKLDNKAVRLISLMSYLCKLMERMLYYRLSWFIEFRSIFRQAQSGFGLFRTCEDNLITFTTAAKTDFLNRSPAVAVFLDIAVRSTT